MSLDSGAWEIVCENLRVLSERAENNGEQIRLCAAQLAEIMANGEGELTALWQTVRAACPIPSFKARLCECLCKNGEFDMSSVKAALTGDTERVGDGAKGRIAYVRNNRNDKIFLKISKTVQNAKAYYAATFIDACEAVFNGNCEFCVLPVHNDRDGKLYSFYSMLDRYELKIVHVVSDENDDARESVTFALVGRWLTLPKATEKHCRFEFSIIASDALPVAEAVSAIGALGGRVIDVGTQPVVYDEPRRRFYFSADMRECDVLSALIYLSLEHSGFVPVGLYGI